MGARILIFPQSPLATKLPFNHVYLSQYAAKPSALSPLKKQVTINTFPDTFFASATSSFVTHCFPRLTHHIWTAAPIHECSANAQDVICQGYANHSTFIHQVCFLVDLLLSQQVVRWCGGIAVTGHSVTLTSSFKMQAYPGDWKSHYKWQTPNLLLDAHSRLKSGLRLAPCCTLSPNPFWMKRKQMVAVIDPDVIRFYGKKIIVQALPILIDDESS